MDRNTLIEANGLNNKIEKIKMEIKYLKNPFSILKFGRRLKLFHLYSIDNLPIISLNKEQTNYLIQLKEQELRELEKEMDSL